MTELKSLFKVFNLSEYATTRAFQQALNDFVISNYVVEIVKWEVTYLAGETWTIPIMIIEYKGYVKNE
ncbi:MAG: hypothetical protein QW734_03685 [Candidatus Bathyarchaeia archaeon]